MSSHGVVQIGEVLSMLEACAPGHIAIQTDHHYRVAWRGKTYPALPLGEHGRKRQTLRAEVKIGHVRKMVRHLEIPQACVEQHMPQVIH